MSVSGRWVALDLFWAAGLVSASSRQLNWFLVLLGSWSRFLNLVSFRVFLKTCCLFEELLIFLSELKELLYRMELLPSF